MKDPATQTSSGGDFMVDVFKTLNIDYLAMNCASSFRGLHEAVLNYNNNKPEILTCPHEEIAVAMGARLRQDRRQADGHHLSRCRRSAARDHGDVQRLVRSRSGLCMGGNIVEADKRMPGAEWVHSAIDIGALTRDFTKWDDQPTTLQHFAESAVRAYKVAMTPPMGPVLLSLDAELQEHPIHGAESLRIPKLGRVVAPVGDSGAIADAAKILVSAENPVIVCDRLARTPAGMARLVELAETLQCAVIDNAGRMNFPSRHALNMSFRRGPVLAQADVILALEMNDLWGVLNQFSDRIERSYRPVTQERRPGHHARHARSLPQGQLSGLRPLPGCRSLPLPATARRRCRR